MIGFGLVGCTQLPPSDGDSTQESPKIAPPTDLTESQLEESSTDSDSQAIATLISDLVLVPAGEIGVEIAYNDGDFATGTLTHTYPEAVQGKMWIVAKNNQQWELVHYGSPGINCDVLETYEVPNDLVEVCIASPSGTMVQRNQ